MDGKMTTLILGSTEAPLKQTIHNKPSIEGGTGRNGKHGVKVDGLGSENS